MTIAIIWRRSGIAILFYFTLVFWLTSYGFDKPYSLRNAPYCGWAFLYTAIAATLHALLLLVMSMGGTPENTAQPQDENALVPRPDEGATKNTIWSHSFFLHPGPYLATHLRRSLCLFSYKREPC